MIRKDVIKDPTRQVSILVFSISELHSFFPRRDEITRQQSPSASFRVNKNHIVTTTTASKYKKSAY